MGPQAITRFDACSPRPCDPYQSAVERYDGSVRMPVGLAGPLQIIGNHADGSYEVPLATTEGALVASYHRGCLALNEVGGCRSVVVDAAMSRTPCFRFHCVDDCVVFVDWVKARYRKFSALVERTSGYCRLRRLEGQIEGNHVYLLLEFTTGQAAGQNMVTIATESICRQIVQEFLRPIDAMYIEANLSGDKKATASALGSVRGKRVVAEARLNHEVCESVLSCSPRSLEDYWFASAMGGTLSGAIGLQGHFANALAAIYIALGQDAACVAESAIGITRMVARDDELYVSVTLPNVIVGTVGGGTGLPDQSEYLRRLHLPESEPSNALAEIIGAVCLAGELSIAASITSGSFARAHRILGRRRSRHV
jgi:hydroxymethylglutaryl-CoA reductase (NADPH)